MTIATIVCATQNEGKVIEMKNLLAGLPISVLSAKEAGVTDDVVEDGETLEANALKKSDHVARKTGQWSVADDSGLFIKSLGNAPGVLSSRWAGPDVPRKKLPELILGKLQATKAIDRTAYFESAIALTAPTGEHWTFTGRLYGTIAPEQRGTTRPHLPYDTIFLPKGSSKTFSEMTMAEKNSMSHRGQAFHKLQQFINTQIA